MDGPWDSGCRGLALAATSAPPLRISSAPANKPVLDLGPWSAPQLAQSAGCSLGGEGASWSGTSERCC